MFDIAKFAKDKCSESILITGSARSGTTILGQLLASFSGVEYSFEPPLLFSLFGNINSIPERYFKLLFNTYLYEEILMGGLSGRTLNLNRKDDSSVYHYLPEQVVKERILSSHRKADLIRLAEDGCISFKMPDVVPFVGKLLDYFPKFKIIQTIRSPESTFNSILGKNWFNDDSLSLRGRIWPSKFVNDVVVPYWVPSKKEEQWVGGTELERIAIYYIEMTRIAHISKLTCVVDYDEMVTSPRILVTRLCQRLGLEIGTLTDSIIAKIRPQITSDKANLRMLGLELREEVYLSYANSRLLISNENN